jgi:hypothetical protein
MPMKCDTQKEVSATETMVMRTVMS